MKRGAMCGIFVALSSVFSVNQAGAFDLQELSATEVASRIKVGEITSTSLVAALLQRAAQKEPLNSVITLNSEGALKRAAELDAEAKAGKFRGPLHGVPIFVKDNINVAGMQTTAGTPGLEGFVAGSDAAVVRRLIEAGAIVLAKTNMHELAWSITSVNAHFGAVANAYDPTRVAGGSSGGTAVGISVGIAPAGLGTDTAGSVRIPAALNGIAGLRPSQYRYPLKGIVPLASTRDTAGPMARTVADLVLLDGVITGTETELAPANLEGIRLGLPASLVSDLDPETDRVFREAVEKLEAEGATIVEADIGEIVAITQEIGLPIIAYEFGVDLAAFLAENGIEGGVEGIAEQIASPDVKYIVDNFVMGPNAFGLETYRVAQAEKRPRLQRLFADYFGEHELDAMIFPTTQTAAVPIVESQTTKINGRDVSVTAAYLRMTGPGSTGGLPGVTLPAGLTAQGLPIGVAIDGPVGSDRRLLSIALAMESVLGSLPPP